jgi:RNA polymerase sigma factor (sigma-70 family)
LMIAGVWSGDTEYRTPPIAGVTNCRSSPTRSGSNSASGSDAPSTSDVIVIVDADSGAGGFVSPKVSELGSLPAHAAPATSIEAMVAAASGCRLNMVEPPGRAVATLGRARVARRQTVAGELSATDFPVHYVVLGEMSSHGHVERLHGHEVVPGRDRLAELFESTFDDLYRYCLARTASRSAAEEAASEAFLAAARTVATGRGDVNRAWLFVVARNRIVDECRRAERQRRRFASLVALRRALEEDSDEADRIGVVVIEVLRRLPERQRAAVALRYLDGCTVGQVAVELEIEYTAAESLLARGRKNFTTMWKEHDD